MARLKKLTYDITNLSPKGLAALRAGWCIDEDPNSLWLSKDSWFDHTHDERWQDTKVETSGDVLETLFSAFVNDLGLTPEDQSEVLALWDDNPANEVEWD
ncbi:hypothetical protein N9917_01430 [Deltaproteobacteria bacterium]|nr:hypothetical protein [Deltaproteobacteria bacterium]